MIPYRIEFPTEVELMRDPVHVEFTVHFDESPVEYPFEEMYQWDFFRIPDEDLAKRTRAAVQRHYQKEPVSYYLVRKYGTEWICRRAL